MRTLWNGITVDAIDYELIRLSSAGDVDEIGSFRDVHVSSDPTWRLVAGYLMLASLNTDELGIFSHGRIVASLRLDPDSAVVSLSGSGEWEAGDGFIRAAGIALVSGSPELEAGKSGIRLPVDMPWELTIVHGPAPEKIDARIDLLASLRRVGGRRG